MKKVDEEKLIKELEEVIENQKIMMSLIAAENDNPTVKNNYYRIEGMVDALEAVKSRIQGNYSMLNIWK